MRLCKGAYKEPERSPTRPPRGRPGLRPLPAVLMEGDGYPMVATPRPPHGRDRRRPGRAHRPRRRTLRVPDALRHPPRRAAAAGRPRRARSGSTCPTVRSGTATSCDGSRSGRANLAFFLRSLISTEVGRSDCVMGAQVAILGAGVMGETLLSGLIRAGRPVDSLLVGEKRSERATELRERYGVDGARQPGRRPAGGHRRRWSSSRRTWPTCSRRSRPSCAPASWSSRWPRASPPGSSSPTCPTASPWSGSCRTRPPWSTRGWPRSRAARTATRPTSRRPSRCWPRPAGCIRVPERQQDAVTAISGSGPAYLFFVVEAMIEAGRAPRPAARPRRPSSSCRPWSARPSCCARPGSTRPCCASR